jgi:hypothetical protein
VTLREQRVTRLSLAVRLEDELAPARRVVGEVTVSVQDRPWRPSRNPSGDFLFVDLPPGRITVRVAPALYLDESREVVLPLATPLAPVLTLKLEPSWRYPFPAGATLVQGLVRQVGGAPIAGATVTLTGGGTSSRSGPGGRFVIALTGLTEDDVSVVGGRRLVKAGASGTTFTATVQHPAYHPATTGIGEIEEGTRTVIAAPLVLNPL